MRYGVIHSSVIVTISVTSLLLAGAMGLPNAARMIVSLMAFVLFYMTNFKAISRIYKRLIPMPVAVVLVFFLLSISYSEFPVSSGLRFAEAAAPVFLIFSIKEVYGRVFLMEAFARACLYFLLASFVAVLLYDGAIHRDVANLYGDWHGMAMHKGVAGVICVMGIILFIGKLSRKFRIFTAVIVFAFSVFIINTGSRMSFYGLISVAPLAITIAFVNSEKLIRVIVSAYIIIGFCVFVLAVLAIMNTDIYAKLVYSNVLTGRPLIWNIGLAAFYDRPFLGYGFGGFWRTDNVLTFSDIATNTYAVTAPHSHNAFMEMMLSGGSIGLALCVWAFFIVPAGRLYRVNCKYIRLVSVCSFCFLLLYSITEVSIMKNGAPGWMMFILTITLLYPSQSEGNREGRAHAVP